MCMTDHIFPVLPINHLVNKCVEPTMPYKLATVTKPSASNLRLLICTCVVRKATAHADIKALNMHHQSQRGFHGISVIISQHQKGYLIYLPITRKIYSSHDVVFKKTFSGTLSYTSRPY